MIRRETLVIGIVLVIASAAWGQLKFTTVPRMTLKAATSVIAPFAAITNFTPPPSVTITANNPGGVVSSPATPLTVNATKAATFTHPTWMIEVAASNTNMSGAGCPSIPISAMTVVCSTPTAAGRGSSATCASNFTLSTTFQTLVSGLQGDTGNPSYGATVTYNLADSYQFYATNGAACTLTLSYRATFN